MTHTDHITDIADIADGATPSGREERLEEAVAALRVGGTHGPETRMLVLAGILLVASLALVVAGWWGASGTLYVADQVPYVLSGGLAGVAVATIGAALYLRFSLGRYLRYWLLRAVHEQREQTQRLVEEQRRTVDALVRIEVLLAQRAAAVGEDPRRS